MKKIAFVIIVSIIGSTGFSQDLLWEHFYGGSNNDLAHDMILLGDDGVITVGYTESYGTGDWGIPDMWMAKFDSDGQMIWDKTYGEPDSLDKAYGGIMVSDGYLLVGERMEDIVYGNGMSGIIVKTDLDGNEIWTKKYKGDDKDMLRFIYPVENSGFIASGATRSNGAGFIDGWALKLDEDCNIEWQSNFGGDNYDVFKQIYPLNGGGYIAGGFTNSDGYGSYDIWFVLMDESGNLVDEWKFGNEYSNRLNHFIPTYDGGYVYTGRTQIDAQEKDELYVTKLDSEGNIEWDYVYPSNNEGEGFYVEEVLGGGYLIAGNDANDLSGPWQTDGWLLRLDANGELLWDYFVHNSASDVFYAAKQNLNGEVYVAGGNMSIGNGMNDLWLLKLNDDEYITAVQKDEVSSIQIYPNPANDYISVFSEKRIKEIQLFDQYGKLIRTAEINQQIKISDLSCGLYLVKLISESNIITEQLLVR